MGHRINTILFAKSEALTALLLQIKSSRMWCCVAKPVVPNLQRNTGNHLSNDTASHPRHFVIIRSFFYSNSTLTSYMAGWPVHYFLIVFQKQWTAIWWAEEFISQWKGRVLRKGAGMTITYIHNQQKLDGSRKVTEVERGDSYRKWLTHGGLTFGQQ